MKKHVFLNGFMGAGKSKIGPYLAQKFACPFHDTDKIIETEAGKKVSEIFKEDGEQAFRDLESKVIESLAGDDVKAVIALGGGALVSDRNRMLAKKSGIIVYVKSSPQAIMDRVKNSKKRPLLNIPADEHFEKNLFKMINNLLLKRKAMYEQAHLIFDRDNYEYEQAAEQLHQELISYEDN